MSLSTEQKQQIVAAVQEYMTAKQLKNTEMQRRSGVPESYISQMLRGIFTIPTSSSRVAIGDKYFRQLATAIELSIKKNPKQTLLTPQFMNATSILIEAKETVMSGMIIGESGCSKTTAVNKFHNKYPKHTYVITINNLMRLPVMLDAMLDKFGINQKGLQADKLQRIIKHIKGLSDSGEKVLIIWDESENMELPLVRTTKSLYDGVKDHCSIMLIGTPQLLTKLAKWKDKDVNGIAQFCRRFKANTYMLADIDTGEYQKFFDARGITDAGLQKLLISMSENYGELDDYIDRVTKEAEKRDMPVSEDLFRLIYNLPKRK